MELWVPCTLSWLRAHWSLWGSIIKVPSSTHSPSTLPSSLGSCFSGLSRFLCLLRFPGQFFSLPCPPHFSFPGGKGSPHFHLLSFPVWRCPLRPWFSNPTDVGVLSPVLGCRLTFLPTCTSTLCIHTRPPDTQSCQGAAPPFTLLFYSHGAGAIWWHLPVLLCQCDTPVYCFIYFILSFNKYLSSFSTRLCTEYKNDKWDEISGDIWPDDEDLKKNKKLYRLSVACFQAPRADHQATAPALANWPLTPVGYCAGVPLFLGRAPAYCVTAAYPRHSFSLSQKFTVFRKSSLDIPQQSSNYSRPSGYTEGSKHLHGTPRNEAPHREWVAFAPRVPLDQSSPVAALLTFGSGPALS